MSQCIVEALEERRLMSVVPAPYPGFVGPLPQHPNPMTNLLPPGSAPSAELVAGTLTSGGTGSYAFKVIYRDDLGINLASIDNSDIRVFGPNGYERTASFIGLQLLADGAVVARYKVGPPGGNWNATDNGRYIVTVRPNQVFDNSGVPVNAGIVGEFIVQIPGVGNPPAATPPKLGLDVRDFGAIPNDGRDDSDAIQRAIDALPKGVGSPVGETASGGIVLLGAGVWDIAKPLKLHSGVTLRGAGAATVIHSISTDRMQPALLLYSPFSHRWNIGVSVENLTIYTRWGDGIAIDPGMGGDVLDLRLANLRVSALGTAINLRHQAVYHSEIENVEVYNPGSTAIYVGRFDGHSANIRVRNFSVTGSARNGFRPEQGLVILTSDVLVRGMTIKTTGANIPPLYISHGGANSGSGGITLYGLDVQVPSSSIPGGIMIHLDDVSRVDMDFVGGVGIARKIRMTGARDVQIGHMQSDGSSNVISHITMMDAGSYLRVGNSSGGRLLNVTRAPAPAPHVRVPAPSNLINAEDFGVVANDGLDDTAALQAAIDSLPRGNGIPGSSSSIVGGIVQLPLGIIQTNAPITLPSGVWLRGHNNGTVIRNETTGAGHAVIELTSPYTHGRNVGAGLVQLGIFSKFAAAGVTTDSTLRGDLRDLTIADVRLACGGPAIDLSRVQVNYALLDRIVISKPGAFALWLGRADNSSTGNIVRGVRVATRARPNFQSGLAMFVYRGDTTVEGGSIEDTNETILAFYASGTLTMDGLWLEWAHQPDGIGLVLDNVRSGTIDRLYHVNPERRLHLINGSNVHMRSLNIDGFTTGLRECVSVDGNSRLTLGTVNGQWDSGMLDHPRVIVRGVYNERAGSFVETSAALAGNLLADPNMTDVADDRAAAWHIQWGDQLGGITGTWAVETVGSERRLRLTVASNPNNRPITVRVKVNMPASAVGRHGIARWKAEGPSQVLVWMWAWSGEFQARAMKSLTAVKSPIPMRGNEEVWIQIPAAAVGTYYLSKVGLVAAPD